MSTDRLDQILGLLAAQQMSDVADGNSVLLNDWFVVIAVGAGRMGKCMRCPDFVQAPCNPLGLLHVVDHRWVVTAACHIAGCKLLLK